MEQWTELVKNVGVPAAAMLGMAWFGYIVLIKHFLPMIRHHLEQSVQARKEDSAQVTAALNKLGDIAIDHHKALQVMAQEMTLNRESDRRSRR